MGALTHFSNLLLTVYRQAQELPVDEFQDGVLSALKRHLPFDKSMWGTATLTDGGLDVHTVHLHNTTQALLDAYEKVKHLDIAVFQVMSEPTATRAFRTESDLPGRGLDELRQFLHEYRIENYLLTASINPVTKFMQGISLYREDRTQVCTPEETEFLSCVAPHLMQALAINRLVHLDRLIGDAAREKWSVAIADSRGVLYHADRRFRELVRSQWTFDDEDRLPRQLLDRLKSERHVDGTRAVVRMNLERGLLFLKAREREAVDDLSQREFLVARLLAAGLSHKQVAVKLDRSPTTIRSQVKSIFDKLGINNVALLAPLLAVRD